MDTICAISTPRGKGGISVIRLSGSDAFSLCDKVFRGKRKISGQEGYTILFGKIVDGGEKTIDSVLVSIFKAPASFTGEDVCEVSCHGGVLVTQCVLDALLGAGARLALPGEFTKRAFLMGKMTLTEAESVRDIIDAQTTVALDAALSREEGALSQKIAKIREPLLDLAAAIGAAADFPEENAADFAHEEPKKILNEARNRLDELLLGARRGAFLRDGARVAIVGMPNTGKSSILNALVESNRAIVTDVPGTTRDIIEEWLEIDGIAVRLGDTAGIRDTDNDIERIGVQKAREYIKDAAVCIFVTEAGRALTGEEKEILEEIGEKPVITVVNKIDTANDARNGAVKTSALLKKGMEELRKALSEALGSEAETYVANERVRSALFGARNAVESALQTLENGFAEDMAMVDIAHAVELLGESDGMSVSEEIIDTVFSKFCLGK